MKLKFLVKTVAVIDYDTEGRTVHILHPNGFEEWKEYYDDGKKVHCKDSEGREEWWEYFEWVEHDHFLDSTEKKYGKIDSEKKHITMILAETRPGI